MAQKGSTLPPAAISSLSAPGCRGRNSGGAGGQAARHLEATCDVIDPVLVHHPHPPPALRAGVGGHLRAWLVRSTAHSSASRRWKKLKAKRTGKNALILL